MLLFECEPFPCSINVFPIIRLSPSMLECLPIDGFSRFIKQWWAPKKAEFWYPLCKIISENVWVLSSDLRCVRSFPKISDSSGLISHVLWQLCYTATSNITGFCCRRYSTSIFQGWVHLFEKNSFSEIVLNPSLDPKPRGGKRARLSVGPWVQYQCMFGCKQIRCLQLVYLYFV